MIKIGEKSQWNKKTKARDWIKQNVDYWQRSILMHF